MPDIKKEKTMAGINGVSIILPALNEEKNIKPLIEEIRNYFSNSTINYEIIIVDDGSTDSTGEIADSLSEEDNRIRVIHHNGNLGYGKAIRDGFDAGKYDCLFYTDADRQFRINDIDLFLTAMNCNDYDMVVGYRQDRQDNIMRKFLSWSFNRVICMMFSIQSRDIDCAFKMIRKDSYNRLNLSSDDFLIDMEMLAKASLKMMHVTEIPVKHYPRAEGESTVSLVKTLTNLLKIFSFYFEFRKLKKEKMPAT